MVVVACAGASGDHDYLDIDKGKVQRALRDQGWRLERTKSGLIAYPAGSEMGVAVHRDPSPAQLRKCLSRMRRLGLQWPWPPRKGEGR